MNEKRLAIAHHTVLERYLIAARMGEDRPRVVDAGSVVLELDGWGAEFKNRYL